MGIIYCYTNKLNNKKYIGQTINPEARKNSHKSEAFNEKSHTYNSVFHRAIRKYGYENFTYEILEEIDESRYDTLNDIEESYIQKYNTLVPNGYNIYPGGNTTHGRKMREEFRRKKSLEKGILTEEQVIDLRKRYANGESPSKIYKEYYQDIMAYSSFLNVWDGHRYELIMPEVFNNRHHTKFNEKLIKDIRLDRELNKLSYQQLANKYNIPKSSIVDIIKRKTWKHVQ